MKTGSNLATLKKLDMSEISQKQEESGKENAKLGGVKTEEDKAVSWYNGK